MTGGDGTLASYISWGKKFGRGELDVADLSNVRGVLEKEKPDIVLHLAALTDIKKCEEHPELTREINELGTGNIAKVAKEIGAKVIYVSTNAVFDGEKREAYGVDDIPKPINVYGKTKYAGELAVLDKDPRNLVVRTSWIFGGGKEKDKKFVSKIIQKLRNGEAFSAVNDIKGTPTYAKDLAEALHNMALNNVSGIVHVVNSGSASRYDMVLVMKEALNSKSQISGAPLSSFDSTGNTLRNETLNPGEYALRSWQEALIEYVHAF